MGSRAAISNYDTNQTYNTLLSNIYDYIFSHTIYSLTHHIVSSPSPLHNSSAISVLQTDLIGCEDELHKPGVGIDDVLNVLLGSGVEVGRVSKLQSEAVRLAKLAVLVSLRECPVVRST